MGDGLNTAASADSKVMDFGSVFLVSPSKEGDDATPAVPTGGQTTGINVAELVLSRGFGNVIKHRDFEERSNYYDALLAAESRAMSGKKGIFSSKEAPAMHITDLTTVRNETFSLGLLFRVSISVSCKPLILHRPRQKKPETSYRFYNEVEGTLLL